MEICHACGGKASPGTQYLHHRLTLPLCGPCAQDHLVFFAQNAQDNEEIEAAALTALVPMLIVEFIRGRDNATLTPSPFEPNSRTPSQTPVR